MKTDGEWANRASAQKRARRYRQDEVVNGGHLASDDSDDAQTFVQRCRLIASTPRQRLWGFHQRQTALAGEELLEGLQRER